MLHIILTLILTTSAALAQAPPTPRAAHPPLATVRLIADRPNLEPGQTQWMAMAFEIPEGWHLYWKGLNDSGLEPSIALSLPEGFTAGDIAWPAPRRKITAGLLLDHVYEKALILPFPVHVPQDAPRGRLQTVSATVTWLICKEVCIPEEREVARTFPVGMPGGWDAHEPLKEPWQGAEGMGIMASLEMVPKAAPQGLFTAAWKDNEAVIRVPGAQQLAFFPKRGGALPSNLREQGAADGQELHLDFEPTTVSLGVTGVLEVRTTDQTNWYHIAF